MITLAVDTMGGDVGLAVTIPAALAFFPIGQGDDEPHGPDLSRYDRFMKETNA